jgi:serine/threonine protein phosphatase PrpC
MLPPSLSPVFAHTIPPGDHAVKAVGVIPEPEVKIFDLDPFDQFMIMASDGVWEFITSQVRRLHCCMSVSDFVLL